LEGELRGEVRHEYLGGIACAMAGTTDRHNIISVNIASALHMHLFGKSCRAFINDMKVRVKVADRDIFYYPDVMVTCGQVSEPPSFTTEPVVIVEVLSPETEAIDRREKFSFYTLLTSLQAYVLVDQEKTEVTVFRRAGHGWSAEYLRNPEDVVCLEPLAFELSLAAAYDGIEVVPKSE
jgi:Uma2 family endonuclease